MHLIALSKIRSWDRRMNEDGFMLMSYKMMQYYVYQRTYSQPAKFDQRCLKKKKITTDVKTSIPVVTGCCCKYFKYTQHGRGLRRPTLWTAHAPTVSYSICMNNVYEECFSILPSAACDSKVPYWMSLKSVFHEVQYVQTPLNFFILRWMFPLSYWIPDHSVMTSAQMW